MRCHEPFEQIYCIFSGQPFSPSDFSNRSFIRDITENRNDATIVETTISMSHHLGLEVVAEGVETQEQHFFLSQHACDIFQGYYFSKPVKASEFIMLDVLHTKYSEQVQ